LDLCLRKSKKLIEVYRSASEIEAQVIKGLLESYGVPCLLKSNAAPSVHMFTVYVFTVYGMGKVKVMVWDSAAERAKKLIEGKDYV